MTRERAMTMARKDTTKVLGHDREETTYIYAPKNLLSFE